MTAPVRALLERLKSLEAMVRECERITKSGGSSSFEARAREELDAAVRPVLPRLLSLAEAAVGAEEALVSLMCMAQALKGGDSPLWEFFCEDALIDDHSKIADAATYTAVYAADELDKIEEKARAALSALKAAKEKA